MASIDAIKKLVNDSLREDVAQRSDSIALGAKERFLTQVAEKISADNSSNEEKKATLETASAKFDEWFKKEVPAGAARKGDPATLVGKSEETAKQEEGFTTAIKDTIGGLIDGVGGVVSLAWKFLQHLPGVGGLFSGMSTWLADAFSGKSETQRETEKTAAGAATPQTPLQFAGVNFSFDDKEQRQIYEGVLRLDSNDKPQFTPAATPSTSLVDHIYQNKIAPQPAPVEEPTPGLQGAPPPPRQRQNAR